LFIDFQKTSCYHRSGSNSGPTKQGIYTHIPGDGKAKKTELVMQSKYRDGKKTCGIYKQELPFDSFTRFVVACDLKGRKLYVKLMYHNFYGKPCYNKRRASTVKDDADKTEWGYDIKTGCFQFATSHSIRSSHVIAPSALYQKIAANQLHNYISCCASKLSVLLCSFLTFLLSPLSDDTWENGSSNERNFEIKPLKFECGCLW
jgi:hypothetical protein